MKKGFIGILIMMSVLLTFVMTFGACSSGPVVFDKSVSAEQSSILNIIGCQVREFNGTTVSGWNGATGKKTIMIPAGEHSLKMYITSFEERSGRTYVVAGNIEMTYNFLPGQTYLVTSLFINSKTTGFILDYKIEPNLDNPTSPFEGKWVNTNNENHFLIFIKDEFLLIEGKYQWRGLFTYNDGTISIRYLFRYDPRIGWMPSAISADRTTTYNYKDNIIEFGRRHEMKKQE